MLFYTSKITNYQWMDFLEFPHFWGIFAHSNPDLGEFCSISSFHHWLWSKNNHRFDCIFVSDCYRFSLIFLENKMDTWNLKTYLESWSVERRLGLRFILRGHRWNSDRLRDFLWNSCDNASRIKTKQTYFSTEKVETIEILFE